MAAGILIFGPQGCGKTRHAERLKTLYGMTHLIDDDNLWQPGDPIPDDTLVLTNEDIELVGAVPFYEALARLNAER